MKKAVDALIDVRKLYKIQTKFNFVKLTETAQPWKVESGLEWAKKNLVLNDPKNFGVRGLRHLTGTVGQLLKNKDPNVEGIFQEGLSHSDAVSKRYYTGNLATRLIQGYGIPLMEQMVDTRAKAKALKTVTTKELGLTSATNSCLNLPSTFDSHLTTDNSNQDGNFVSIEDDQMTAEFLKFNDKTPVVRTPWTSEQDNAIIRQFYKVIKMSCKVSSKDIKQGIKNEPTLKERSEAQVRTRLSHIRLGTTSTTQKMAKIIEKLSSRDAKKYGKK